LLRRIKHIITLAGLLTGIIVSGQFQIKRQNLRLKYDSINRDFHVRQEMLLVFQKQAQTDSLFLLNWVNAYKNKNTPLARRFIENYDLNFHFTRQKNRGKLIIDKVFINDKPLKNSLQNYREEEFFVLKLPKKPNENDSLILRIDYYLQLPNSKFTGFGVDKNDNINLDNFYFLAVDKKHLYAHKNIDDYYESPTEFTVIFKNLPTRKNIYSNLKVKGNRLSGYLKNPVVLITGQKYKTYRIENREIIIPPAKNIKDPDVVIPLLIKIQKYMGTALGEFPYAKILISEKDLKNNKVYGPDLLPSFARPFSDTLIYEVELLHQISRKYIMAKQIDNRKYAWISMGIPAFLEYNYIEKYEPDLKLLGNLASFKLIRFYYASQVKMNEKYPWLYLYVARMNKDQSLNTSLDSLTNFNRNVASPYKSALGLLMLSNRIGNQKFTSGLKDFYQSGTYLNDSIFYQHLIEKSEKNWFDEYVNTRYKYDYRLKKIKTDKDSLFLQIETKRNSRIPVHLYGITQDSVLLLKKLPALATDTTVAIVNNKNYKYIGLNYYNNYPEYQIHDNYKRPGNHLLGKPLQIRPYQDFDNPLKNQIFVNPFFEYNYYDGVIIGSQIMNESFLHNEFFYSITPSYATKNNSLTGSISFSKSHYFTDYKPYAIKYGIGLKYYHYDHDLAYRRINPYISLKFRNKYIRKRQGSNLNFQVMYIDKDPRIISQESDNYTIFDTSYKGFDVNVIKDFFYKTDLQLSSKFGKLSGMLRYRYLTNKNRQWDFRLYAGTFLYNHTNTDYFSFALDRPTDYMFRYNYYGRSETSGIFHQQFIWAEGGFKTFFDDQFANEFIVSNNVNIGVWKWFNLYADWAWKKNKGENTKFYYDSGVRINLVQDYFEVFFPVYSKLGWEINQANYPERIRLVFVMNINGLFKMIRRGWY